MSVVPVTAVIVQVPLKSAMLPAVPSGDVTVPVTPDSPTRLPTAMPCAVVVVRVTEPVTLL